MGQVGNRALTVGGALLAVAAIYGMARISGNGGWPASMSGAYTQSAPLPAGPGANELSRGEMAAFVFRKAPEPLPDIAFVDASGKDRRLADWNGRVVLLNLWATWCAPCRREMPALDRLQKTLGSERFEVVALAVDRAGVPAAAKFLDGIKPEALKLYVDASARSGSQLRAIGMPTTLLIDRQGREIGRLIGPAEWDSSDARRLIEAALQ